MSLIRVGLSETKDFADGYDAIFKKKPAAVDRVEPPSQEPEVKPAVGDIPENPFRRGDGIGC